MAVIKEVDLEDFIAESEHDGVFSFEPLLYVDELIIFLVGGFGGSDFGDLVVEVDDEFLEEHELFLKIFVVGQGVVLFPHIRINLNVFVLARRVLNIGDSPKLFYKKILLIAINRHQRRVIKINSISLIVDQVPQSILGRIVHKRDDIDAVFVGSEFFGLAVGEELLLGRVLLD